MSKHVTRSSTSWPIFGWLQGYQRDWLRFDVIAGLTVCAILVPEGMAYAELAGVPPEYAFYAAPAALLAYAALGSSRQLVVAVSSAIAIMSAGVISELATQGTAEYVALTAALAILVAAQPRRRMCSRAPSPHRGFHDAKITAGTIHS